MKTLKFNQYIAEASKTEAIYNDYPAAAKANAKKALKWREEHGRDEVDGGTEVGWARANQLAKGEKLSRDVVSRMAQFNRHRKNSKISAEYKSEPWKDRGYIAWLIWGGDEGVDWAMKKMDEIEAEETNESLNEKRPEWQDADWPDAEGRFVDLSPKDLAAWLIKTRKKDLKAISGSLTQQVVFNRNDDPEHAEKMEKTRKEVYKQLGRQDLLDKMDEAVDIDKVEKYADKVMDPIDVEFTKHFYDQLTRAEHSKEITDAELIGFFKRLAKKKKDFDKFKQDYDQFVAKDNRSQINIPFKNKVDQIIAKTIMRKDDFKTSNAEYKFENKNTNMKHVKLFEAFVNEANEPKGRYKDVEDWHNGWRKAMNFNTAIHGNGQFFPFDEEDIDDFGLTHFEAKFFGNGLNPGKIMIELYKGKKEVDRKSFELVGMTVAQAKEEITNTANELIKKHAKKPRKIASVY